MDNAPSRRLRLRFFPEDEEALDGMLKATSHASKSSVIRGALTLFDLVWNNKRAGFRVVFLRDGAADRTDVLDSVLSRKRKGKTEDGEKPSRPKTEKSIEIRLSRTDEERIDRLLGMEAASTFSEVVRRSVRLYAAVVDRCKEGWSVAAWSPSGDIMPISVPGLGAETPAVPPVALTPLPEPIHAAARASAPAATLLETLPRSLAENVCVLAAREGCSADLLLIDMVRTEAFARLGRIDAVSAPIEAAAPPAVAEPPAPVPPAPEPPPVEPVVEAIAAPAPPIAADVDTEAIEELSKTLEQMADNIEKVMQLAGAASRSKDQQAQLTDLFLGQADDSADEELSPTQRLFQRAQELNERLNALVAFSQRERKPRASKAARQAAEAPELPGTAAE